MAERTCTIDGCDRRHKAHGWCRLHYNRWQRWGDPEYRRYLRGADVVDRFWSKVARRGSDECWLWLAGATAGYGSFWITGRGKYPAHRFAYETLIGPIPDGLILDHLCRNTRCVNPSHLEPVTNRENVRRGMGPSGLNASKSHCIRGHELAGDNLRIKSNGNRDCRACADSRARAKYVRKVKRGGW